VLRQLLINRRVNAFIEDLKQPIAEAVSQNQTLESLSNNLSVPFEGKEVPLREAVQKQLNADEATTDRIIENLQKVFNRLDEQFTEEKIGRKLIDEAKHNIVHDLSGNLGKTFWQTGSIVAGIGIVTGLLAKSVFNASNKDKIEELDKHSYDYMYLHYLQNKHQQKTPDGKESRPASFAEAVTRERENADNPELSM
jgi:hypothetical protein